MNECSIVIFGATGDLTRRKILPALYKLLEAQKIKKFIVVGVARDDATPEQIIERAGPFILNAEPGIVRQLKHVMYYHQLKFDNESDYISLRAFLDAKEKERGLSGNRLVFLASPPQYFCGITRLLAQNGVVKKSPEGMWHRVVYEKPFGSDLQSAREINQCIKQYFDEQQIYRLDHYLSKELVGNIALLRFTNMVFEPLWNKEYIDNVQIVLNEKVGLAGRGSYYDAYGVVKDMVQSHAFQLMALTAMESPKLLTGDYIRDKKSEILRKITPIDGILGQYVGYTQEPGVRPDSKTPTFCALKFEINNNRWKGVPWYVKSGKYLHNKETIIFVTFKSPDCLLAKNCPIAQNCLAIRVEPDSGFVLELNAKTPGATLDATTVPMEFCYECLFGPGTPAAYELLLQEVMRGEESVSVRFDEIEYQWAASDVVTSMGLPMYYYDKGNSGPPELQDYAQKHNMRWHA